MLRTREKHISPRSNKQNSKDQVYITYWYFLLNITLIKIGLMWGREVLWLRAFCPQACYAGGPGPFRYLLYKDVNRHVPFL
jgi:hypothetical protein